MHKKSKVYDPCSTFLIVQAPVIILIGIYISYGQE
jgi:hypothetical protein